MQIQTFRLERWQSLHEHEVEINLSDSGVHPLTLGELLELVSGPDGHELEELMQLRLGYTQTNGTPELRTRIAELYPGATPDEVEATSGGAEANLLSTWTLLEPGDEVVSLMPNYMQVAGLAQSLQVRVKPWWLRIDDGSQGQSEPLRWRLDLEQLERLVGPRTKLISLSHPNNPTGLGLRSEELDAIATIAERHGAWIHSDEIYRGSELDGREAPTFWGRSDRVVVTSSLSKAYGLPGLRLGWLVAPRDLVARCWARHDYTTIAPSALGDALGVRALDARARLIERTQKHLRTNLALAEHWLAPQRGRARAMLPEAGAMLFLRYSAPLSSTEFAERMLAEKRVLLVPGEHYDMEGWLRLGFGGATAEWSRGLARLGEFLDTLDA